MSNKSILKFSCNFAVASLVSMIMLSGVSSAQAAELPSSPYLPLELAQKAADAAMAQCLADGFNVSVAVVERSGATKVLIKGDNSGPHTVGSSTGKAFTAASMGRSTLDLANFLKEHRELDGLRDMDPRMVILGGGLPIKINGALVGGIGVGGAPGGDKDEVCAKAGLASIGAE
ncbi:GlcG/HbpS family heme-binding protein [Kiloniella laminariae]|uniref:GlcG/HbpS family heme-binding protein n=1 Tax=Kiloniella laminariae TaxID=454162 RepID=UPI000366F6E5|nr:heme-binding protein [Kiloniella laminariae]